MPARRIVVAVLLLATLVVAAPVSAGEVETEGVVHGGLYSSQWDSASDVNALTVASGKRVTFLGTFHDTTQYTGYYDPAWSNVKAILDYAWAAHTTPFANFSIPATAASIASGSWDTKIDQFASHVEAFLDQAGGRSLILAPLQEMNGTWTPYGCNATAFKTAYIKIHTAFRNRGMDETQVRFAFAPNGWTSPSCGSIADYYPGDRYVDLTAFSAYNFGTETGPECVDGAFGWESPYQVLIDPTNALKAIAPTKPIIIAQTAAPRVGCGATTGNGGQSQWVRDLFTFAADDSNIVGLIWFNFHNGPGGGGYTTNETDWRIWTGSQVTQGWTDAMARTSTQSTWPLTSWFQPGELVVGAGPGPCPDGETCDTAVFVTSSGQWHRRSGLDGGAAVSTFYFGNPGDVAFTGDWDCDGERTPGLYRQSDGYVYLRQTNTQGFADITFFFGNPGDVPIVGDFDGDDCDTVSIYRPSEGRFYIINQLGENDGGLGTADYDFVFGNPYDQPFVGDFDGDGVDTVGLYRVSSGYVYFRNTNNSGFADLAFYYGDPGDIILAGDWDGDGDDTVAVYRPGTGRLYVNLSNAPTAADHDLYVGTFARATRG